MHSVGLFDCITGQGWFVDLSNSCLYLDGLSDRLGQRRYQVVTSDGIHTYLKEITPKGFSLLKTCAKIVCLCTLILPLIMLWRKWSHFQGRSFILQGKQERLLPLTAQIVRGPVENSWMPPTSSFSSARQLTPFPVPRPYIPPPRPVYVPPPVAPWPTPKSMEEIRRELELEGKIETPVQQEEGIDHEQQLWLEDEKKRRRKVNRDVACQKSETLRNACQESEGPENGCLKLACLNGCALEYVAAVLNGKIPPTLDIANLIECYEASYFLEMKESLASCRQQVFLLLLHGGVIANATLKALWLAVEKHRDKEIQIAVIHHANCWKLDLMIEQQELLDALKRGQMSLECNHEGVLYAMFPFLTLEAIEKMQQLGIEHVKVASLFSEDIARSMQAIKRLIIADSNNFHISERLLLALFHSTTALRSLKLCYGDFDEGAAASFSNSKLEKLQLIGVKMDDKAFALLLEALRQLPCLTDFEWSHAGLNNGKLQLLLDNLKVKTLTVRGNKFTERKEVAGIKIIY